MSQPGRELDIQAFRIEREPFYAEVRGEVGLFTIAAKSKMPVMLKGPIGSRLVWIGVQSGGLRLVAFMVTRSMTPRSPKAVLARS